MAGTVTIADDGKYTANLSIKTTGLFVEPSALQTRGDQERRVKWIADHVLPNAKLADFSVKTLAPGTFEVEARIEANEPLSKLHECYTFELPEASPASAEVAIPIVYSRRHTAARVAGPYDERIDLNITWPEAWHADAVFAGIESSEGPLGQAGPDGRIDRQWRALHAADADRSSRPRAGNCGNSAPPDERAAQRPLPYPVAPTISPQRQTPTVAPDLRVRRCFLNTSGGAGLRGLASLPANGL